MVDSYFIHDQYAGISAYINSPGEPSARNANMLAVGALVPLDHGKMGKSWLHAESLKDLARYGAFSLGRHNRAHTTQKAGGQDSGHCSS